MARRRMVFLLGGSLLGLWSTGLAADQAGQEALLIQLDVARSQEAAHKPEPRVEPLVTWVMNASHLSGLDPLQTADHGRWLLTSTNGALRVWGEGAVRRTLPGSRGVLADDGETVISVGGKRSPGISIHSIDVPALDAELGPEERWMVFRDSERLEMAETVAGVAR